MDELIERLKEFQAKGVKIMACTIVLKEKENEWKNYLITTDTWGELYIEDIT
jgi:predicted peroxiredoxin